MDVVVVGNVTLDVLCFPVEDVPRFDSISFENSAISPGGCGSNVAIGLAACGVDVALVARLGDDDAARLASTYWKRWGIDLHHLRFCKDYTTAISVGLIDRQYQPRFIHTPGANSSLSVGDINPQLYHHEGAKFLFIAGYFVLPGLLDEQLGQVVRQAQDLGMKTVLDVVHSPRMNHPEYLWPVLPGLDVFLCNSNEAMRITGAGDYLTAAADLRRRGAKNVIVKLGDQGCYLLSDFSQALLAAEPVESVIDTTGAGDAFAAGLVSALVNGKDITAACQAGIQAAARIVSSLGAITGWGSPNSGP